MSQSGFPDGRRRDSPAVTDSSMASGTSSARLKCPACLHETAFAALVPMDAVVICDMCGAQAEFRQFHEAWCESRRSALVRACPALDWLVADSSAPD